MASSQERDQPRREAERPPDKASKPPSGTLEAGAPEPAPPLPGAEEERRADPTDTARRTGGGSG